MNRDESVRFATKFLECGGKFYGGRRSNSIIRAIHLDEFATDWTERRQFAGSAVHRVAGSGRSRGGADSG